ncbi:LysR family transcriptional regulator [Gordonia bronchialis]|uniref:LysR family transcriptional regulator n=1 Tax=Gordonia bronchialis TaxID=2054 RepID=UPI001CBF9337|nr:LysR family transcriptional regulator [Gordonia bronchialis]UAK36390.1 LysR family transcriptional regulator [Gordonia bronchialis]
MDITFQQLRCFVVTARTLHFGNAAQELHISPSTFSDTIAALEKRLGRKLFRRDPRRVALTEAGAELLPLAQQVQSSMDAVGSWIRDEDPDIGTIRVGLMVSSPRIRAVLAEAAHALGEISWEIKMLGFDGCYRALDDGQVDAVFVTAAGDLPAGRRGTRLWSEGCVVVTSRHHRLARLPQATIADLAGEKLITNTDRATSGRWTQELLGGRDIEMLAIADSFEEVLELCSAGIGVNVAGASAVDMYTHSDVAFVPLVDAGDITTYLCPPADPSPAVRRFVDLVCERYVAD